MESAARAEVDTWTLTYTATQTRNLHQGTTPPLCKEDALQAVMTVCAGPSSRRVVLNAGVSEQARQKVA